jgi:hypothetical protein
MDDPPGATSADLLAAGVAGRVTVMGQSEVEDEYLVSNLAVHTVPVAWFINADVMAELSPDHRDVLREAASYIQAQKLEETADVESTLAFCATGGTIVEAAPGDLAQIVAAAQPVVDMLTDDPVPAQFIARIRELKAQTEPAAYPAPCGGPSTPAPLARIPDGTYTTALTKAYAVETGWRDCIVDEGHGVSMLIIEGVSWAQLQGCGNGIPEQGAAGTFECVGDQAIMREPGIPGQATFSWSVTGDTLSLKLLQTDEDYAPTSVLRFLFEHDFTAGAVPASDRIPDGTYTAAATRAWALETGFPDECALADLGKSVTLVIRESEWTELQTCGADPAFVGSFGTLQYDRDHVTLKEDFLEQGPVYAWSIDGDVLSMDLIDPVDPGEEAVLRFLFEHDFKRSTS